MKRLNRKEEEIRWDVEREIREKEERKKERLDCKLLALIKNFDFQGLKSSVESLQATAFSQDKHLAAWAKSSTSMTWNLGPRHSKADTKEPPSHTKGENDDMQTKEDKVGKEQEQFQS
ncbi:hypothetical protein Tco_0266115 [Tanacetum coccineum]